MSVSLEPGPGPVHSSPEHATLRPSRFFLGLFLVALTSIPVVRALGGEGEASRSTGSLTSQGLDETNPNPGGRPTESSTSAPTVTTTPESDVFDPEPNSPRYLVADHEAEPTAKQLAVDIAHALTTYDPSMSYEELLVSVAGDDGAGSLLAVAAPLFHPGYWSRGSVIYPQMGGLRDGKASVMVVTRQMLGRGSEPERVVTRTLDIRLVAGDDGWEFVGLASAGGDEVDRPELLFPEAIQVLADSRIDLPDSARWDIYRGQISPKLLRLMLDIAEQTSYGVVVLSSGHPYHVFGTDRQSQHTSGMAVDIHLVGDKEVIDDRHEDSLTRSLVEWLYDHPDVRQIGSPWDLDGQASSRSFTDRVHQDHIHVAANG